MQPPAYESDFLFVRLPQQVVRKLPTHIGTRATRSLVSHGIARAPEGLAPSVDDGEIGPIELLSQ